MVVGGEEKGKMMYNLKVKVKLKYNLFNSDSSRKHAHNGLFISLLHKHTIKMEYHMHSTHTQTHSILSVLEETKIFVLHSSLLFIVCFA